MICSAVWLVSLTEGIATAGFCYIPAYDGITNFLFESQCESHFYFTCAYALFASAMTLSPRFPDIWMFFWSALMLFLMSRADPFFWSAYAKVGPFVLFMMGTILIIFARCKMRLVSYLDMRRLRASNLLLGQSFRDPHSLEQLRRLERTIWEIARSIPVGTMARQFNLKFDDIFDRKEGRLPRSPAWSPASSAAGSHSGETDTKTTAFVSGTLLSAMLASEQGLPEPWSLLGNAPSKRMVSKRGAEVVMAAVAMTNGLVHDPMSPMTSMDQLWTQATLLSGPLKAKVPSPPLPGASLNHCDETL